MAPRAATISIGSSPTAGSSCAPTPAGRSSGGPSALLTARKARASFCAGRSELTHRHGAAWLAAGVHVQTKASAQMRNTPDIHGGRKRPHEKQLFLGRYPEIGEFPLAIVQFAIRNGRVEQIEPDVFVTRAGSFVEWQLLPV